MAVLKQIGAILLVVCVAQGNELASDGLPGCRCLGDIPSHDAPEYTCDKPWASEGTCVNVDNDYGKSGWTTAHSSTYGTMCSAHAEPKQDKCYNSQEEPLALADQADWCSKSWCYVDPCHCDQDDVVKSTAFPGRLSYSYKACGSIDDFSVSNTDSKPGSADCDPDKGFTDERDACVDPLEGGAYEMHLPYVKHNQTIVVPEIPTDVAKYSYATEKAMVAIPAECAKMFDLGPGNFVDRPPGGPTGMHYMRVSDPDKEYGILARMGKSHCAAGLVLLLHGTTGARWNAVSMAAMASGLGYVVVTPDSHAMPDEMGLKGAKQLKSTAELDLSNYCGAMDAYASRCDSWGKPNPKPFCYSTKAENVLNHRVHYKRYVERNYLIRKLEMDYFVENQQMLIDSFSKVYLLGRSEGGMSAARYYHAQLHPKLAGMMLSGASCEYNYFVSCPENAVVCGGHCSKTLPILSINGDLDNYFGNVDSVSTKVSASVNGYGAKPITGDCNAAFQAQGFRFGVSVRFPPAKHGILYSHDNAVRSVIADFMAVPTNPSNWHSLQREGCTWMRGVYKCDPMQPNGESPCVSWKVNPNASWVFKGSTQQSPMTCGHVKAAYKKHECCGAPEKPFSM